MATELEAEFVKPTGPTAFLRVDRIGDAFGVFFICPACFEKNDGAVGTHWVLVFWKDPGPGLLDGNPLWKVSGTGMGDLTLKPSIDLTKDRKGRPCPGCTWHGFITAGSAR